MKRLLTGMTGVIWIAITFYTPEPLAATSVSNTEEGNYGFRRSAKVQLSGSQAMWQLDGYFAYDAAIPMGSQYTLSGERGSDDNPTQFASDIQSIADKLNWNGASCILGLNWAKHGGFADRTVFFTGTLNRDNKTLSGIRKVYFNFGIKPTASSRVGKCLGITD